MSDEEISKQAVEFVKVNKKVIIEKFASLSIYKPSNNPETFFMAGSPGAGKTEASKDFIAEAEKLINQKLGSDDYKIVRIDGDEIRDMLPNYNGNNSDLFQRAISNGVEKLIDHCFSKKLNMLVDGTFSHQKSVDNIERAIKYHNRAPHIIYVYQDPLKAWELTKAREAKDGRSIPLDVFVGSFFLARDNINKVKKIWGDVIRLHYLKRDFETNLIKYKINIDNIDKYLDIKYTKSSLIAAIKTNCN